MWICDTIRALESLDHWQVNKLILDKNRKGKIMSAQIDRIKEEMAKTRKLVDFWIRSIAIGLIACCFVGVIFLLLKCYWIAGVLISPLPVMILIFVLPGFMIIQPEERIMVEFLGRAYCVKGSGLRWVCPLLMSKRMIAFVWEQSVELFPNRIHPNGIHIDLKGGGKTELVEPVMWVQMDKVGTDEEDESMLRMVYGIDDWKKAVQESAEDALRTCLNNLTIEEMFSVTHDVRRESWWEAVREYFPALENTIRGYGLVPKRLTISDFNPDENVVKVRQEIFQERRSIEKAKLSKEASKDEIGQKALEIGGLYGTMVKLLMQKQYGGHTEPEAKEIAKELVIYYKGADTGTITHLQGGGDLSPILASILSLMRSGSRKNEKRI